MISPYNAKFIGVFWPLAKNETFVSCFGQWLGRPCGTVQVIMVMCKINYFELILVEVVHGTVFGHGLIAMQLLGSIVVVVNDDGLPLHSGESIWFRVEERSATVYTLLVPSILHCSFSVSHQVYQYVTAVRVPLLLLRLYSDSITTSVTSPPVQSHSILASVRQLQRHRALLLLVTYVCSTLWQNVKSQLGQTITIVPYPIT